MNLKIQILIISVILMTGLAAAETQSIINSIDADQVVQVGDMDNLGFGWPPGFDVFSGMSTPIHSYPFQPGVEDPPGTDMIMVGTSYNGSPPAGLDGYTRSTKRPANLPQAINMRYDLNGAQVNSATFQMFVDDFQSPVWKSKFQVTLNGKRASFMEDVLNTLVQSGPIGKLITVQIPSNFLPMVRSGQLNISIDDPTTGAGDGFAIDFVRLLINPHITTVGNVSGKVTDNSTGAPLKGVVISASGTVITRTISGGKYLLEGVPAGLVVVNASKKGYIPQSKSIDLIAGSNISLNFALQPIAKQTIVENNNGYDLISYVDGLKDVISGDLNYRRWDGVWRPKTELNISNGSWPYRISQNKSIANFNLDGITLSIPKANTKFKQKLDSISYDLIYSKSDLLGKEFLDINYSLKSKKQVIEYKDDFNIRYGRLQFKAGTEHISVHDDTLRNYTEDGKVFQDVTYLTNEDYDFRIVDGNIRLAFKNNSINKLHGNVIIEIRTWEIVGANNSLWGEM